MNKDSFCTIRYKNGFIHTCYNRNTNKYEVRATYNYETIETNSLAYAKRWITKQMKGATK